MNNTRTILVRRFVVATDGRTPLKALWTLVAEAIDEAEIFWPAMWNVFRWRAIDFAFSFSR